MSNYLSFNNFSEKLLKFNIFSRTITSDKSAESQYWKHNLSTSSIFLIYDYLTAQCLFEFAYLVSVHNRQFCNNLKALDISPANFDVIMPINAYLLVENVNVLWFLYSDKLNAIVLVFTGTYNDALITVDLDYFQQDPSYINNYVKGMKIHGGFSSLYSKIQKELQELIKQYYKDETKLIITGYSLGAAVSTIAAYDLYDETRKNIYHYAFASPRVFNDIAVKKFNSFKIKSYRIVNTSDIIPILPLPIVNTEIFSHTAEQITFDDNLGSYYDNHVTAYVNHYKLELIS